MLSDVFLYLLLRFSKQFMKIKYMFILLLASFSGISKAQLPPEQLIEVEREEQRLKARDEQNRIEDNQKYLKKLQKEQTEKPVIPKGIDDENCFSIDNVVFVEKDEEGKKVIDQCC